MPDTTKPLVLPRLHGIPLRAIFVLAALVWMAGARASLVVPDLPRFVIAGAASTSAASSGPADSVSGTRADQPAPEHVQVLAFNILNGSTLGMSSSPTAGSGSASNVALRTTDAPSLSDLAFIGWVTGERRFFLPDPPGNDLLRPPQVV